MSTSVQSVASASGSLPGTKANSQRDGVLVPKKVIGFEGGQATFCPHTLLKELDAFGATNDPLYVISVTGLRRSGKSFLLNLMMNYLDYYWQHVTDDGWEESQHPITGVSWGRGQKQSVTQGIWMLLYPKLVHGRRLVFLDCQGTGENEQHTPSLDKMIMFYALKLSDLTIINIRKKIEPRDLDALGVCQSTSQGKQLSTGFKDLSFLIRDWPDDDQPMPLAEMAEMTTSPDVKEAVNAILKSCCTVQSTGLPHPGKRVSKSSSTDSITLADVDEDFVSACKEYFRKVLIEEPSKSTTTKEGHQFVLDFKLLGEDQVGKSTSLMEACKSSLVNDAYTDALNQLENRGVDIRENHFNTERELRREAAKALEEVVQNYQKDSRIVEYADKGRKREDSQNLRKFVSDFIEKEAYEIREREWGMQLSSLRERRLFNGKDGDMESEAQHEMIIDEPNAFRKEGTITELEANVQDKDSKIAKLEEEVARLRKLVYEDDSTDTTGSEPPGSPECDDDDESLEDYSKFDDHDIPEELHDDLVRLCEERQVAGFQFYQNPVNFNEIVVTGCNTSNFKPDDFENVRGEKWREYTITAEEEEMDCYTEQHTDIRQFAITQLKGTCELIVEALDAKRKRRKYAVGPAHCMFPREKNLQLQKGNDLVQASHDVQQNPAGKHYKIQFQMSPDQFKVIDAFHPPIFSYRYKHDRGDAADPSSFCLNDLVLLRIRNRKAEGLQSELRRDWPSRRERLIKFKKEGKLNKYIRPNCEEYKIQVKNRFGCLIPNPQGLEAQRRAGNGICLLFKLDDGFPPLEYGDSGSIVFEVRNGRLHTLGLYIGVSKRPFTKGCYQAAILDLCFQDIKRENPDHLTTVPVLNDQCPDSIAANRY